MQCQKILSQSWSVVMGTGMFEWTRAAAPQKDSVQKTNWLPILHSQRGGVSPLGTARKQAISLLCWCFLAGCHTYPSEHARANHYSSVNETRSPLHDIIQRNGLFSYMPSCSGDEPFCVGCLDHCSVQPVFTLTISYIFQESIRDSDFFANILYPLISI